MDGKRSIQDIIPPARSRPMSRPSSVPHGDGPSMPPPPTPPSPMDLNPNRPRGLLAFFFVLGGALLIASVVIGALSTVFHRAYITVTPYSFDSQVDGPFSASVDGEGITYHKVSTDAVQTKTVTATGSKHVEDRAQGILVVYNAFNVKPERFITNTRFSTKDGLIFRVHSPVVIPGYTIKAGVKVPGSVEVTVYADEPGEKYNAGLADFTIPGLKGTPQFDLMYAKSKTPVSGGFVGERAIVDEKVRADAIQEIRASLDRTLREKMKTVQPEGAVVFDSTVSVNYIESPDKVDGGNAVLSVTGVGIAPAFDESTLAAALAEAGRIQYDSELKIENPNELTVSVTDPTSVSTESNTAFTVSGIVHLTAVFNEEALIQDLSGKKQTDITAVRANYPGIESLKVKVYPFWRGSIPTVIDRISVEVVTPVSGQ